MTREDAVKQADDLIYRRAAINALCSQCTVDKPETCSTIQENDRWCKEVYALLNLPPAQPEPYKEVILYPQVDGITPSVINVCTDECRPELNDDTNEVESSVT